MNKNNDVKTRPAEERDVLFSLTNLKQYFPVKGNKKAFVKANDGITLKIYKGETFGLVGESGCGKSTLGRVILRLYDQTDGRTMYYGRTLDELAPSYMDKTYKNFYKMRDHVQTLKKRYDKLQSEYDQMNKEAQFEHHAELMAAEKRYRDSFFHVVKLVGGFYGVEKPDDALALLRSTYDVAHKRAKLREKLKTVFTEHGQQIKKREAIEGIKPKEREQLDEYYALSDQLHDMHAQIDALKAQHAGEPEFDKYEAYYDKGIDISRLTYDEMRPLRRDLQLVFQDPYSSLNPRLTAGQIIAEGMSAHGIYDDDEEKRQEHIIDVMERCGLQAYMIHRYPHQFSGGQRQRIGIARSLALDPTFVVCDEAVSALDVSIQSQIINLLSDMKDEQDLTYLFISHDLSVIKYISDRIAVMYLGNLVELSPTEELFENPRHPYTEALLSAIPTTDPDARDKEAIILEGDIPSPVNPPAGCKFHTRCRYATEECRHIEPEWEEVAPNHFVACHHKLPAHTGVQVESTGQDEADEA